MLPVRQNERKKAFCRSPPHAAKIIGCSRVLAHSLMGRFEQTRISIDAEDRCKVRKQCQDKTVNLHSCIDVGSFSWQL